MVRETNVYTGYPFFIPLGVAFVHFGITPVPLYRNRRNKKCTTEGDTTGADPTEEGDTTEGGITDGRTPVNSGGHRIRSLCFLHCR